MTELQHSPARILRQYLIDADKVGINDSTIWPSFIAHMPTYEEVGGDAVLFTDTEGRMLGRILRTGEQPERYGIQVRFRSFDADKCWAKAKTIQKHLDTVVNQTVTVEEQTYTINSVHRTTSLLPMGYESETRLYHVSSNYTITIE